MSESTPWHALSQEEVFERLRTTPLGLSEDEARRRLEVWGPNRIEEEKRI